MRFDETRTFGVEIEAYNVYGVNVASALNSAGIPCTVEHYNHETRRHWKIVHDGSVRGRSPFELVSPPLAGQAGLNQVVTVMSILRSLGAKVNATCGLHVHHSGAGLRPEQLRRVEQVYSHFYPIFRQAFPNSRQFNQYCQVPSDGRVRTDSAQNRVGVNRYRAVNLSAMLRHGTVEFRQHQGTLNGDKAEAWIVFTQELLRGAVASNRMFNRKTDPKNMKRGILNVLGLYNKEPLDGPTARMLKNFGKRAGWRVGRMLAAREVI